MTPLDWAVLPFKHYADFTGRSPRAEYWWYLLAVSVVGFLLGLVDRTLLVSLRFANYGPLGLAFTLAIIVPGLAVMARRMHDVDRSGWWSLVKAFGYAVSFWVAAGARQQLQGLPAMSQAMSNVLISVFIIALTVLICAVIAFYAFLMTRGTVGPNRYGPDPYGRNDLEEVFA